MRHSLFDILDVAMETPSGEVNFTAISIYVGNLSSQDRANLFKMMNISSLNELFQDIGADQENATSLEEELMKYCEYRLHKHLRLYIPPILLLFGTLGNILSCLILMRNPMRKFSTYNYLAVLSIADTLVLYIGLLRLWIGALTGHDPIHSSTWLCKLINVMGSTVSDYSVWLIIAVTVERYVAIVFPLHAPSMCNRRRATVVVTMLFLLLLLINMHFIWTVGIGFVNDIESICQFSGPSFETLVDKVWPWIDAFIYSFLPFVVIIVLNCLIIRQVIVARRSRCQLQYTTAIDKRRATQESSLKLTIMLLTISFAFLATTLPMNLCSIASDFVNVNDTSRVATFTLGRTISELLMYVNHSMNFFLYCATGQKFRQQLLAICGKSTSRIQRPENSLNTQVQIFRNGTQRRLEGNRRISTRYSPPRLTNQISTKAPLVAQLDGEAVEMKVTKINH